MEPPAHFDATSVRDEKVKVLRSLRPIDAERAHPQRARPVRSRLERRHTGERLSPGARPRQRHRDLRGDQGSRRQLALAAGAILPAHRQTAGQAPHRDRHPVQERAALDLFGAGIGPAAQYADHRPAAGGKRQPPPDVQGTGPRSDAPSRGAARHQPAQCLFGSAPADRLRAFAPRSDGRRSDPVRPPRRGRGAMDVDRRHPRRLGGDQHDPEGYAAGTWGPSAAVALTERDGVSWHD